MFRATSHSITMQKILTAVFAVAAAVCGWLAYQSHDQLSAKDARIASLAGELSKAQAAEKDALSKLGALDENIARLTAERNRLQAQLRNGPPGGGPGQPPGGLGPDGKPDLGGLMAMFRTSEGRKMFQSQSASLVRAQYSQFAKRMKLSPQDSSVLMGLLADRQTALTSARVNGGGNAAETAAKISAIESDFNDKIRATLGDSAYGQFTEYEQAVPDRMAVDQFEGDFASAGTPLEGAQKESLIELMKTERQNSAPDPFDPTKSDPSTVLSLLKDDTTFSAWEKDKQDYQNRVLQSAAKTLTPDQVNTLKQSLEQKLEREKQGLQIFKTTGAPPPPPPTNK